MYDERVRGLPPQFDVVADMQVLYGCVTEVEGGGSVREEMFYSNHLDSSYEVT